LRESVYLIDGTAICYRSFFAIKLSTSKGFPSGAVYGFFQTLKKIISKYNPKYMGVCFDVSRKTFRQEKFEDYKIQRPPLPDSLRVQVPLIKRLINYLGITLIEKEMFEAEDIIASLSAKAVENNLSAVIVSSDKDLYQLLDNGRVMIYNPTQDRILTEGDFLKEYGFPPSLVVDYLALAGDSIDNIPGAQGIGKTGASQLIKSFGTIENIFNNLDNLPPKLRRILSENKENIFLSKELVKLSLCELNLSWEDLRIRQPDYQQLYRLFNELEFKAFLKDIPRQPLNLKIDIKEGLEEKLLDKIKTSFVFFTEGESSYILLDNCIYRESVRKIKHIFADEKINKISYDFKEQMMALDIDIKGAWFDVKVAGYLADSSLVSYDLPTLISHYLGHFSSTVPSQAAPYFIEKLYRVLYQKLKDMGCDNLFFEVEMPLVYVLVDMQKWGVNVDVEVMDTLLREVEKELIKVREEVFKITGRTFNLNSPKALSVVLFEELNIPPIRKTKTGYSTSEDVLEQLSSKYPIAHLILDYRYLNKLKTTYIKPLIENVKFKGGRLFATFNQTATQTGRLSCSSPNLQSIPVRGKFSSYLRKAFISTFREGYILSADYSQIELRILAHFSGDNHLMEAFRERKDIHRYTASLLFGVSEDNVSDKQRNLAKRVNFGIVYGMSAYGLSKELKISPEEAQRFIDDYFSRYPKVKEYIERICKEAEDKGYVKTILGRRRSLADIKSNNLQLREFSRRQAINAPIQGSCADLIKMAMVTIQREFQKRKLKAKMIIQIHDELLFDVPPQEVKEVAEVVKRSMEEGVKLKVPIEVNLKVGKNWAEGDEVK
jgi:DNA polymerase-1